MVGANDSGFEMKLEIVGTCKKNYNMPLGRRAEL